MGLDELQHETKSKTDREKKGARIVENCSNSTERHIRYDANYEWEVRGMYIGFTCMWENKAKEKRRGKDVK